MSVKLFFAITLGIIGLLFLRMDTRGFVFCAGVLVGIIMCLWDDGYTKFVEQNNLVKRLADWLIKKGFVK